MMTVDRDLDIRRQEAATWFARLGQRRVSTDDVRRFSAWRKDPRNARAYERVEAAWAASETLAADPDMSALTREALGRARPAARAQALVRARWKPIGAVTAAAALLLAGLWAVNRPAVYVTDVGEQRIVRLADGSRLTLDTATRVRVRLAGDERTVDLVSGQALFDVAGDPARPFVVRAGQVRVTALGTRFDVRRSGDGARVTLVEGRIAVREAEADRAWTLTPGEQVLAAGPAPVVRRVDVARETSWTTGRLIFDRTPIAAAVAEVNRYSEARLDLRAAHLAEVEVSGVFDAGDTEGFVAALGDLYGVTARAGAGGSIVLTAPAS